ncbi:hypothetical protein [Streptomyces sp. V3I7]|uniref:hypothetical protein n=1 Tax=Streptomyces sp. V3I7 TaxID=3042278 RepID=UPI002787E837|nr:hypothetical protein [Streptomyces sp. V3I7]MDQ0989395.1 hypothetical protein [Streptomyces sp. V3I7]
MANQDGRNNHPRDADSEDASPAFQPLSDDEIPAAERRLTIGELAAVAGVGTAGSTPLATALGPTTARLLQQVLPAVVNPGPPAWLAEAVRTTMPHSYLTGLIPQSVTSQLAEVVFAGSGLSGRHLGDLYASLGAFPGLPERLRDLDAIPDDTVDAPDEALVAFEESARRFAASERGRSWEDQQRIFAGAIAALVLLLLLQAMVTSEAFKELTEDTATVSGAIVGTYLCSKRAWAAWNPKPDDTDEDGHPE